ncbi:tetratricopeptide repeat protein [Candidatus Peregrinibacteria bacterium]|nr:tetratricopeptide repeat protein [Candidatus Peregrinibacteria bacterium]
MQWKRILRSHSLSFALLIATALIVYASSLWNDFVIWDDDSLVYLNPLTQSLTWKNFIGAFSSYDPELYVPLTIVSFQAERALFGFVPFFFHLDNLLLHAANTALALLLFVRLGLRRRSAFIMALVFAVHPINAEAVAWVSARKDLLAASFSLGAMLSYLQWLSNGSKKWFWVVGACMLLALLSKPVAVSLPLAFLLLDWKERRSSPLRAAAATMPFFMLGGIFLLIGLYGKSRNVFAITATETMLLAVKSTVFSVQKFIWPGGLSPIYLQTGPIDISLAQFFVPAIVLAAAGLLAWQSLRKTRIVMFSTLFYMLFLMPSFSNFAKDDIYFFSDRYIYISQIGLLFMIGCAVDFLRRRALNGAMATAGMIVASAPIFLLAWSARSQSLLWKDSETLYRDALKKNDGSAVMHYNLAVLEHRRGNRVYAFEEYRKTLAIDPKHSKALGNLGVYFKEEGQTENALEMLRLAIESDPGAPEPHNTIGSILMDQGDVDGAMEEFGKSISLNERFAQAHINLAAALGRKGLYKEGLMEYRRAFELAPQLIRDDPEIKRALENL